MKNESSWLSPSGWAGLLLVVFALLTMAWQMRLPGQGTAPGGSALNGAWRLVKTTAPGGTAPDVVKILVDNSFTFAEYDRQQQRFIGAGGGTFSGDEKNHTETFEYFTRDSSLVGTKKAYTVVIKGNTLLLTAADKGKKVTETWQRVDGAKAPSETVAGAWRIRERETQPGQMSVLQQGPRKTIKWLSDTRFQWAAINTQTRQFFGTGGGTYTLENGKYTEQIEFFSRDPKRVGMSVSFDYEVKNDDWHHRGLSTTGNRIYEVWARVK
jgi:hypothetical protein